MFMILAEQEYPDETAGNKERERTSQPLDFSDSHVDLAVNCSVECKVIKIVSFLPAFNYSFGIFIIFDQYSIR